MRRCRAGTTESALESHGPCESLGLSTVRIGYWKRPSYREGNCKSRPVVGQAREAPPSPPCSNGRWRTQISHRVSPSFEKEGEKDAFLTFLVFTNLSLERERDARVSSRGLEKGPISTDSRRSRCFRRSERRRARTVARIPRAVSWRSAARCRTSPPRAPARETRERIL